MWQNDSFGLHVWQLKLKFPVMYRHKRPKIVEIVDMTEVCLGTQTNIPKK